MVFDDLKHSETVQAILSTKYGNPVSVVVIRDSYNNDPEMKKDIDRLNEIISRLIEQGKKEEEIITLLGNAQPSIP